MVRALAFHQCGPGSIPGPGVICGLSLLLVLVLAPRAFLGRLGDLNPYTMTLKFDLPIYFTAQFISSKNRLLIFDSIFDGHCRPP